MKKILFGFLGFLVLVSALIVTGCVVNPGDSDGNNKEKVDDWVYVPNYFDSDAMPSSFSTAKMAAAPTGGAMVAEESIGFSTGGAKDVGNFRENIKQGYLPLPTDLTYE